MHQANGYKLESLYELNGDIGKFEKNIYFSE